MRKLVLILFLISSCIILDAQEFVVYKNGLIYDENTMDRLKVIVDSLNLKHLKCDLNRDFYAEPQAKAHYIEIKGYKAKAANYDIANNISFSDFESKYSTAFIDHNLLVTKSEYKNHKKENVVNFSTLPLGSDKEHEIRIENDSSFKNKTLKGKWIYDYYECKDHSCVSITAFYFLEEFQTPKIPEKYSDKIQYSDCIIDTNTQIFTDIAQQRIDNSYEITKTKNFSDVELFMSYIFKKTGKPVSDFKYNDTAAEKKYYSEYKKWDSLKFGIIKKNLLNNKEYQQLFHNAIIGGLENGNSNDFLEDIVAEFISKEKSLELKRNRIVMGRCSQDASPRYHAQKIALLSAETANWGVFIKSHLNIMNDRFDRLTDGSYAYGGRKTYIKELEELKLNVDDLLLGSLFRINNPSKNHYFGNIPRIGRALAEYSNKDILENELIGIIEDNKLDDYNRLIFYFLFKNYNHYIQDSSKKIINEIKLKNAVSKLPEYLSNRINSKYYQFEQLLHNEIDTIKKYFIILDGSISSIGSIDYSGSCWQAQLHDKSIEDNLIFEITIDIDPSPFSIIPLLQKKDEILKRVKKAEFLINHANEDRKRKLEIRFVNDQSFSKLGQKSFEKDYAPKEIFDQYGKYLDDSIFLELTNENGWSRWLILPNGEIMLWHYSGKPPLNNLKESEIKTKGRIFNNSYRIFSNDGKIIR